MPRKATDASPESFHWLQSNASDLATERRWCYDSMSAGRPSVYKVAMQFPELAERGSMAVLIIAAAIIWGSLAYGLRDVFLQFF
jgi:hypothetical protein